MVTHADSTREVLNGFTRVEQSLNMCSCRNKGCSGWCHTRGSQALRAARTLLCSNITYKHTCAALPVQPEWLYRLESK